MFDSIKGATRLYPGPKQIRSQLRVIKGHPQVTRAADVFLTTASVAQVVADSTIFPVARAAATIASEYIEDTSTQYGVLGAAAYVCTAGIHGIVDMTTKVQMALKPDLNSVQVRGQRDQQCDTKMVEMFDYELDQIGQRNTMEQFGKKPSAGVSDDGLENMDLSQGCTPIINVETRNTAKCTLDPYDDWQLIDSDDETDERTEEFQNERLADSDGIFSCQQQAESYKDSNTRRNTDSYNKCVYKSARCPFTTTDEHQRGRQLRRHYGSSDSFVNFSGTEIPGLRRRNEAASGIALSTEDPTSSDEELDPEIERFIMEMKWRQAESTRAERGEPVCQIGDILDNTEFQPSITFVQADLDAAHRVRDAQLAAERAKYEVAEKIINNMPEQTHEVQKTLSRHVKPRTLKALTGTHLYPLSEPNDQAVPTVTRSQPIAIPGAIAREPARTTVKKPSAMERMFDYETSGASSCENDIIQDDPSALVLAFCATGPPFNATKTGTTIAGKASLETACHHREWQLCACGINEEHTHVREDEEDNEFEV